MEVKDGALWRASSMWASGRNKQQLVEEQQQLVGEQVQVYAWSGGVQKGGLGEQDKGLGGWSGNTRPLS